MSLKVYRSIRSKCSILFKKSDGRQILVTFRGSNRNFRTSDVELQGLIEGCAWFVRGDLVLESEEEGDVSTESIPDVTAYTDVTDIQGAIDVLSKDFKVKETKLRTPDQVKKAALENNVEFPNLTY